MKSVRPNGESIAQLCLRIDGVLHTLHRECSDKRVLVVCHGPDCITKVEQSGSLHRSQIAGNEIAVEVLTDVAFSQTPATRACSRPRSVSRSRELCLLQNSSVNTELFPAVENLLATFPSDSPCLTNTRSMGIVIRLAYF